MLPNVLTIIKKLMSHGRAVEHLQSSGTKDFNIVRKYAIGKTERETDP